LRRSRESRALTQKHVADALDWSQSKVVRIENGFVGVSITDLRALLALYKVSDEGEIDRLIELARVARRRPWYRKYEHALDPDFDAYLSYESSASTICTFQPIIPGLLQTEDYARAVMQANGASHIEERLELRLERQAMLERAQGPFLHCVVDEAALHRQVGGPAVMRDQLVRLKDAADQPRISVGIIPFTAGAHPSMTEPFTILRSDGWDEDVLFREAADRTVTNREDQDLVAGYGLRFDGLCGMRLEDEQTNALIDRLIDGLRGAPQTRQPG
jgi:transcriptional regulator with XRE-family HTH domain